MGYLLPEISGLREVKFVRKLFNFTPTALEIRRIVTSSYSTVAAYLQTCDLGKTQNHDLY